MIFSKLFARLGTPAHQSKDAQVRAASLATLNLSNDKDKRIIHELAFNDESDKVMIAALEKLDNFALWMKAAQTNKSARVKKKSQHACVELLEDPNKVDDKLFASYVRESRSKQMQEALLFSSKRLQNDETLCQEVLAALDNENTTRRFFQELANYSVQLAIVKRTDGAKLLSRLSKFARSEEVTKLIEQKLSDLQQAQEKPSKIRQQATLINSRLLALKESTDYEHIETELSKLKQQFEALKPDFKYLDELSSASLTEKYLALKVSVQQKLGELAPAHEEQAKFAQTKNVLVDIEKRYLAIRQQVDLLVDKSDDKSDIDPESKILRSALEDALDELAQIDEHSQSPHQASSIVTLKAKIETLQESLLGLNSLLEANSQVKKVLASLHTELEVYRSKTELGAQEYKQLVQCIESHKRAYEELNTQHQISVELSKNFKVLLNECVSFKKQYEAKLKQIEKKCETKLKSVQRMIADGKFKSAISTFHYAQKELAKLGDEASKRLLRSAEQVKEEVDKLQDLQASIAQPKKSELLEQIQAILDAGFSDPYERADEVKQLRQAWNSLGKLYTKEDDELNQKFDDLIEKAFLPCRAFFAELDKQREKNFQKALEIVSDVKAFDSNIDFMDLSKAVSAFKKRFNQVGDIDRDKKTKAKREFNQAIKVLDSQLKEGQKQHALQKQALIRQLEKIIQQVEEQGELKEAVNAAKDLQQKWKTIGFAGKPADTDLWTQFRELNDKLFNRYHQNITEKKSALEQKMLATESEINESLNMLKQAKDLPDLQFYEQAHAKMEQHIADLDLGSQKKLKAKQLEMERTYQRCVEQMNSQKDRSSKQALFDFLKQYESSDLPESFDLLASRYKAWINGEVQIMSVLQGLDRTQLAQVIAILVDVDHESLKIGSEKSRKEMQLKLMANKLEGNEILLPEAALAAWVCLGPLNKKDQTILKKLQSLFIDTSET